VQLGAFANRSNADKKAGEVRSKTASLGLGAPKINTGTRNGKMSYLVQVGDFATRQEARTAALKLGTGAMIAQIELN
jgi:septal ring-binding cell division protein DamX